MQRKLVVLLLVASMVLGVFSLAVVQAEDENGEGKGRPAFVDEILEIVPREEGLADEEERGAGPPEFVADLLRAVGASNVAIMRMEQLQINGQALESDLPPFIMNGRFLIPIRAVATSMGAEVNWDGEKQEIEITRDDVNILIRIGEEEILVNGEVQTMDVGAQIFAGRAFVPVRFVATALGEDVSWDAEARTAFIGGPGGNDAADEEE